MASELWSQKLSKLADRGNIQTDVRVINAFDFKYEVQLNHDIFDAS